MKDAKHPSISRQEARRLILERSAFQPRVETVPVQEAQGRVTAREARAVNTLPNSPASRMDGIAIKSANLVDGGVPDTAAWRQGRDWVLGNTGVGIPDDYDTVVLIEDVVFDASGRPHIRTPPRPGQNVRPVGEMMRAGDVLVPAHCRLGPAHLALLAAGGVDEVAVLERPRVAVLPTGNELVPAGTRPPRGMNVEANGVMIAAWVRRLGGRAELYPITRDDPADLARVIRGALGRADIVVLNGGTSKGSDDRAIEVLEKIGEILVYEVDYGPGKHTVMAVAGTKPIVGTVGPMVGAEYAVEWYVGPLINKYLSQPDVQPARLSVELLADIPAPMPMEFYARLKVWKAERGYVARPAPLSPLAALLLADAYLRVPREVEGYRAGETVEAELRRPVEEIPCLTIPAD